MYLPQEEDFSLCIAQALDHRSMKWLMMIMRLGLERLGRFRINELQTLSKEVSGSSSW